MGLHRAGFEVVGWDIKPQKNYPFEFHQENALEADISGFDFVWASPPCQAYSVASRKYRDNGKKYPDLVQPTRDKLNTAGLLWVMENVPGSPLRCDLMLCGSMFGLNLVRHRIFETNFPNLILTQTCQHAEMPVTVCGSGTPTWARQRLIKHGRKSGQFTSREKREAMGIEWTNREELSQAIPPAYSEFIGRIMIHHFGGVSGHLRQSNAAFAASLHPQAGCPQRRSDGRK